MICPRCEYPLLTGKLEAIEPNRFYFAPVPCTNCHTVYTLRLEVVAESQLSKEEIERRRNRHGG